MCFGRVGIDSLRGLPLGADATLGLSIRWPGAALPLPTVPHLLVGVLQRRVRDTVGTFLVAVLLGCGVVRLGEGPLRLRIGAPDGARQLLLLRLATLGGHGHGRPPSQRAPPRHLPRPPPGMRAHMLSPCRDTTTAAVHAARRSSCLGRWPTPRLPRSAPRATTTPSSCSRRSRSPVGPAPLPLRPRRAAAAAAAHAAAAASVRTVGRPGRRGRAGRRNRR